MHTTEYRSIILSEFVKYFTGGIEDVEHAEGFDEAFGGIHTREEALHDFVDTWGLWIARDSLGKQEEAAAQATSHLEGIELVRARYRFETFLKASRAKFEAALNEYFEETLHADGEEHYRRDGLVKDLFLFISLMGK